MTTIDSDAGVGSIGQICTGWFSSPVFSMTQTLSPHCGDNVATIELVVLSGPPADTKPESSPVLHRASNRCLHSVRALRDLIARQGFEHQEIANAQIPGGAAVGADTFRDPYFLCALGLRDIYAERDLEAAAVGDLESFLLEVCSGWAFVERQKRMTIDNDDSCLDCSSVHDLCADFLLTHSRSVRSKLPLRGR